MEPELEVELELELEVEQELEPEAQLELELELERELQLDHPIPEKYPTLVRNWELDPDFDPGSRTGTAPSRTNCREHVDHGRHASAYRCAGLQDRVWERERETQKSDVGGSEAVCPR